MSSPNIKPTSNAEVGLTVCTCSSTSWQFSRDKSTFTVCGMAVSAGYVHVRSKDFFMCCEA